MARPPVFPAEEKVRIVLSILAGEITVAEAARRAKVSEQSVGNWKRQFLEAGKSGLAAEKAGPSTREQQLEAEATELIQALGGAAVELRAHPLDGHMLRDPALGQPCHGQSVAHGRRSGLVVGHPAIVGPGTESRGESVQLVTVNAQLIRGDPGPPAA